MPTRRRARLLSAVGAFLLLAAALLVASPTSAISTDAGDIQIKGPGSYYSNYIVSEAVTAGAIDAFEIKVINTGSAPAQFRISAGRSAVATVTLSKGTNRLPLTPDADGYYRTDMIRPGGTEWFVLRIHIPVDSPQISVFEPVTLYTADIDWVDTVAGQTDVKAPLYGSSAADVFARQGLQPWVGGSTSNQIATAPAIKVGQTATFKVKLQNDGVGPATVRGAAYPAIACVTLEMKDGSDDVTDEMLDGTYVTPVLPVHGARTLTVTMRRTVAAPCGFDSVGVHVRNDNWSVTHAVTILVPFPAT